MGHFDFLTIYIVYENAFIRLDQIFKVQPFNWLRLSFILSIFFNFVAVTVLYPLERLP